MLSTLCERVGVAFDVGLNTYRVFERESENGSSTYAKHMKSVAQHVKNGGSLADAIKAQGQYFPGHFGDMVEAGEESGRLELVMERLSDYYMEMAEMRSTFVSSIVWPLIQLLIASAIVGMMIYLPSVLASNVEAQKDLLGLGLVGERGLMIYLIFLGAAAAIAFVLFLLARQGHFNFLADWFARVPRIGNVFRVFPESRFVQTLSLAIYSGIDAWSAVEMSFRSAGTPQYLSKSEHAKKSILRGNEIHEVLESTGLFSKNTIETVETGESSGRLAEILEKYFRHLRNDVRKAMSWITQFASTLIWLLIASILILIIFRVFTLYVGTITDMAESAIQDRGLEFSKPVK